MSKRFRKQLFDFMELSGNGNEGELWLYGDITDEQWYDNDVTPTLIRDSLNEIGMVQTLILRINSYGGSCVAGNAIVNIIDSYKRKTGAKVVAYIDGIAASMGSGIAMAADYIYMAENAIFMVHKPFAVAIGNANDMEHEKEVLDKVEDTLVANYMRHFNGTEDEMRQLMADESWLTADEALTYGLCDEIIEPVQIAASAKGICINGKDFREDKLKEQFKETNKKESEFVFEYDDKLKDFGIEKEFFDSLGIDSDTVCTIIANAVIKPENQVAEYISADNVKDALGADLDAKTVLDLAKAGMEMDHDADAKAKAYDRLVSSAIEDAIKSGIRAKGENFNDTKWKKILATLDYEEIIDQKNEWEAEAKLVLKAGKRVSQAYEPDNRYDNSAVNIDDVKGL